MEKILVTKALGELKILDDRILREVASANFVASAKTVESKVTPNKTKEKFAVEAKSKLQSINDLVERRKKLKAAIVESNSKTLVNINGVEMTVANAIERKTSIEYEYDLLRTMESQLAKANKNVNVKNLEMESKIDSLVETAFGRDNKANIKPEEYSSIAEPYRKANEYSLVDPLSIEEKIEAMKNDLEGFKSEVDSCLQISNCTTYIQI